MERRFTPAITIDGCMRTIEELARKGNRRASVKLALWAAILSANTELFKNGAMTRLLAPYVTQPLPDRETLYQYLAQAGAWVRHAQVDGLYHVERLERDGALPDMPGLHWTWEQWDAWREPLASKGKGHIHGMGYKTVSFAGLLLRPRTCELVPVDRHHNARLGYGDKAPTTRAPYLAIEREIRAERERYGYGHLPLGAWAWYRWSEHRQATGVEKLAEQPESHAALSPRWY